MSSKSYIEIEKDIHCELASEKNHFDKLYEMLKTRKHNISHNEMPDYEEHLKFCKNNPYRYWFIIFKNNSPIGTFYITNDNCVGLNLIKDDIKIYQAILNYIIIHMKPLPPVPSVVPKNFYCNISPSNKTLIKAAKSLGGHTTQISIQF